MWKSVESKEFNRRQKIQSDTDKMILNVLFPIKLFVLHRHPYDMAYRGRLKTFFDSLEALSCGTRSTEQKNQAEVLVKTFSWNFLSQFDSHLELLTVDEAKSFLVCCKHYCTVVMERQKIQSEIKNLNRRHKFEPEIFCLRLNSEYCLDFHVIKIRIEEKQAFFFSVSNTIC